MPERLITIFFLRWKLTLLVKFCEYQVTDWRYEQIIIRHSNRNEILFVYTLAHLYYFRVISLSRIKLFNYPVQRGTAKFQTRSSQLKTRYSLIDCADVQAREICKYERKICRYAHCSCIFAYCSCIFAYLPIVRAYLHIFRAYLHTASSILHVHKCPQPTREFPNIHNHKICISRHYRSLQFHWNKVCTMKRNLLDLTLSNNLTSSSRLV